MDLMSLVSALPGVGPFLPYIAATVAICAALATALPAPKQPASGLYPVLYGALNFVALNFGHARNARTPNQS